MALNFVKKLNIFLFFLEYLYQVRRIFSEVLTFDKPIWQLWLFSLSSTTTYIHSNFKITNLDLAVAAIIHGQYQPRLCSGSYNTWSISTSTLQWQLQYMVNINLDLQWQLQYMVNIKLDFAAAATIHGQYQPWLISSSCNIRSISTSTYCDVN